MENKVLTKLLASVLIITLTFANIALLGSLVQEVYAEKVDKIEFNAYLKDSEGNLVKQIEKDVEESLSLVLDVKVDEGYLSGAQINIEESNFKLANEVIKSELIQSVDLDNNIIILSQVEKGQTASLEIKVEAIKDNINNIDKETKLTLQGKFISEQGKKKDVKITENVNAKFTTSAKAEIEQNLNKVVPFNQEDKKGVIIETVVKTNLTNNSVPVKESKLEIQAPIINGEKPQEVKVHSNGTLATNGDNGISFNEQNYNYNSDENKIEITVSNNEDEQGKVSYIQNSKDEYVVTYIYSENVANTIKANKVNIEQNATLTLQTYTNQEIKQENAKQVFEINGVSGKLVSTQIGLNTNQISKGFIYNQPEKETEYTQYYITDIAYIGLVDSVKIVADEDKLVDEKNEILNIQGATYFKQTKIEQSNFENILGQDGEIVIYNEQGNEIAKINKETENQDGKYVINYEENVNKITIKTSKPVKEGKLQIENSKAIKIGENVAKEELDKLANLQFSIQTTATRKVEIEKTQETLNKEEKAEANVQVVTNIVGDAEFKDETKVTVENGVIETTQGAESTVNGETKTKKVEIEETTSEDVNQNTVTLVNPENKISTSLSVDKLTTTVVNQNVGFTVVLETNDNSCELYENPVVTIELPSYIENIQIKDANILLADGLQIKDYRVVTLENGNKAIVVNLLGKQEEYSLNDAVKGATLTVLTDLDVQEVAPSGEQNIITTVQNKNNTAQSVNKITIDTPQKLTVSTQMTTQDGQSVTELTGKAGQTTVKISVRNDYKNAIKNVVILGRTPFEGNKKIGTDEELGSTFTANVISKIASLTQISEDKLDIYYSENGEADKDINKTENAWTKEPQDLSKVKSYLIVFKDYEMKQGESAEFEYNVEIPGNLGENQATYTTCTVYFDNVKQDQTIEDKQESVVGAQTNKSSSLNVSLSASVKDGEDVQEGQIIKYTVLVENTGDEKVENITVRGYIPEGTKLVEINKNGYYEESDNYSYYSENDTNEETGEEETKSFKVYRESIYGLDAKQTKKIEYEVKVQKINNSDEQETLIENKATIVYSNSNKEKTSNTIKNKVVKGYIGLQLTSYPQASQELSEGDTLSYIISIENINTNKKTNVTVTSPIPEGTTFVSAENANYDKKKNTVTWNVGDLIGYEQKELLLKVNVNNLSNNEYEKTISNVVTGTCSETENTAKSNNLDNKITKAAIDIHQNCDIENETVYEGDTLTYTYQITNKGKKTITSLKFAEYLPSELSYIEGKYIQDSREFSTYYNEDGSMGMILQTLKPGETVIVEIKAKVKDVENKTEISNYAEVTGDGIEKTQSNVIKHTIENTENPNNGSQGGNSSNTNNTYRISGTVWVDANGDGQRDDNESKLGNITVMLLSENGNLLQTKTTSQNGMYTFENLQNGKYIVAYMYDSKMYIVTRYQKDGVIESRNSDANAVDMMLDGQIKKSAVTDVITINGANIYNIDLGLVETNKFDLKLSKTISKITVQTSKGTKQYNYNDETLTKFDINPNYVNGATVVIEYKMKVTNEGSVAGYAKKIVDYIPEELKFQADLNNGWYLAENGDAYNTELANTIINPGETKEVTLVLTKKMTEESIGLIHNTAELYETYNDLAIADTDSTVANKNYSEDDISVADVVISLNTGETGAYIVITLAMITIFGAGTYFIKKKVLRRI